MNTVAREGDTADIWDVRGRTGFMEDRKYLIHCKTKEEKKMDDYVLR